MCLKKRLGFMLLLVLSAIGLSYAGDPDKGKGLGQLSNNISTEILGFSNLMITVGYLAGIGFTIASIFKFKQHKDNPTQVPIGTPFAMFSVGIILVFLPALFKPAAITVFGTSPTASKIGPLIKKTSPRLPRLIITMK